MNFIVYRVTGGINHMITSINRAIRLSKESGRFLIIDCNAGAFGNDFNDYFTIKGFDYSTNYDILYKKFYRGAFEPYKKADIEIIEKKYYLNGKLLNVNFDEVLKSDEEIIYLSMVSGIRNVAEYVSVKSELMPEISKNPIKENYIGVHYRNTDRRTNLGKIINQIKELKTKIRTVYLGTDDAKAYDKFTRLLPDYEIIQYTKPIDLDGRNIHYGNKDKNEVIMTSLIDMFHLSRATYFIPSLPSGFSDRILKIRQENTFFP